jgi:hypothetical protein
MKQGYVRIESIEFLKVLFDGSSQIKLAIGMSSRLNLLE